MKTIFLSLSFLLLFFWLTPGQNAAQAKDQPAESPQIPVPADLLGELEASFQELAKGLASARDAVAAMTRQRNEARDRVASLTQVNESLRQETSQLRETLSSTRADLEQANAERADWQRTAQQLQARLESGDAAYEHLVKLRDQLQSTVAEFSGLQADIADVRGELEAPAERQALKARIAELEDANAVRAAALEEVRSTAAEKIQTAQARLAERAERNQDLAEAVRALENRMQAMEQEHAQTANEMRERIAGLRDELTGTEQQLAEARGKYQQAQAQLLAMREQAAERKARIDSLTSDLAAFETAPAQRAGATADKAPSTPAQQQEQMASNDASDDGQADSEESER